ncbi:MAG: hypothetical protein AABW59_00815 [archaeon]
MKKELLRKLFHVLFGLFIIFTIWFFGTSDAFIGLSILTLIGIMIGISIRKGAKYPLLQKIIFTVERDHEKHFPGKAAITFFLSACVLLFFFKGQPQIIFAAILVATLADTAAALIGKKFGKIKIIKNKTLEGTLAFFVVSVFCIGLFYNLQIAMFCAIFASIIEPLPWDDNWSVPFAVALALKLIPGI